MKKEPFAFDGEFLQITLVQDRKFMAAFPMIDRRAEYMKMEAWLTAKGRRLTKPALFAFHWLNKQRLPSSIPSSPQDSETLAMREVFARQGDVGLRRYIEDKNRGQSH